MIMALSTALVTSQQQVTAVAYGCDFTGVTAVDVAVRNGREKRTIAVPATFSRSDGSLRFTFPMPAGSFYVDYSIANPRCDSLESGLTVLPGHDRNIVVSLTPIPKGTLAYFQGWRSRQFVSGSLPIKGLGVEVVAMDGDACPPYEPNESTAASIEDGSYYVGFLHGKHLFLRLRSSTNDTLDIRLPDALGPSQYVVRDVTMDDVHLLTTHEPNIRIQCIPTASGKSTTFSANGDDARQPPH
jgi:hypothetical protein